MSDSFRFSPQVSYRIAVVAVLVEDHHHRAYFAMNLLELVNLDAALIRTDAGSVQLAGPLGGNLLLLASLQAYGRRRISRVSRLIASPEIGRLNKSRAMEAKKNAIAIH
jgi:hypothetical protein